MKKAVWILLAILALVLFLLEPGSRRKIAAPGDHWSRAAASLGLSAVSENEIQDRGLYRLFLFQFGKNREIFFPMKSGDRGLSYWVFDYRSEERRVGTSAYPHEATAMAFKLKAGGMPFFWLKSGLPITWYRSIPLTAYPEFGRRFTVSGPDEKAVEDFLNQEALKALIHSVRRTPQATLDRFHADGGGEWLVVYQAGPPLSAAEFLRFHEMALKFAAVFEARAGGEAGVVQKEISADDL